MGAAQFDRQSFLGPREAPPRHPAAVIGPLLLAAIVVVGGLAIYKFVIADGGPEMTSASSTEITQLQQRLNTLEKRLDQLERRRRLAPEPPPETKPQDTTQKQPSRAAPPPRIVYRFSPQPAGALQTYLPAPSATHDPQLATQKKQIDSLQNDVSANREEWQATTDRLGTVVGELGSQRSDIESNKATLNQLLDRFQRHNYSFTLQRRSARLRVGPLALWLQNADTRTGRYTMRVLVNDRWVEFKDRALHEAVDFYPSGSTVPIELVVSRLAGDQAIGNIAVPQQLGNP
jgi:hypothetical protein